MSADESLMSADCCRSRRISDDFRQLKHGENGEVELMARGFWFFSQVSLQSVCLSVCAGVASSGHQH